MKLSPWVREWGIRKTAGSEAAAVDRSNSVDVTLEVQSVPRRRQTLLPGLVAIALMASAAMLVAYSHVPLRQALALMKQASNTLSLPKDELEPALEQLAPVLVPYLAAPNTSKIHSMARLAKVPVIMYHDVLPEKEVFFDITPDELEAQFQRLQAEGLTPITMDQLALHLSTGLALPPKPVVLTFDDGYAGHYHHVLPLLRQYGYPGVFSIYTEKIGTDLGRSSLSWEQLREMAADPWVEIAAHSVTHPEDLTMLPPDQIRAELADSKRILEQRLGIEVKDFVYPIGKYDDAVKQLVQEAGYRLALAMDVGEEKFAGESADSLTIERISFSGLERAIALAYGGAPLQVDRHAVNYSQPIRFEHFAFADAEFVLVMGGKPATFHADSRYQVQDIVEGTGAIAAVDGGFFSMELLDSRQMIGPVLSHNTGEFVQGLENANASIKGRPLVLLGPDAALFVPYDAEQHNTLAGIQAILPGVTDAFVAAGWLVEDGIPQPAERFGKMFGVEIPRHRAFWGLDWAGQPIIGITNSRHSAVEIGELLARIGFRYAVMLDSGASTSLVYKGDSYVGFIPRPVPHAVALFAPEEAD